MWQSFPIPECETYHVIPCDDLRPHTSSARCKCSPSDAGDGVYVHHSFDGREFYEEEETEIRGH